MSRAEPFMDRFERLYIPEPNTGCWLWLGFVDGKGYGKLATPYYPEQQRAHRISYLAHVGPIPEGLHVLHRCDVRSCVNPSHLFLGTNADNMLDMVMKGRSKSRGRGRLLSADQVRHARLLSSQGVGKRVIAAELGLKSHHSVRLIVNRKTYRDVI